jgi:nitroimidazol reductase NimA-like FMN-containing flavoprotein (pyridoxamine 5'-phosphate oxidase superfamily)
LKKTDRSKIKRTAKRASYQEDDLYPIIDDLKLAHICFASEGKPMSIPMLCWRVGNAIYIHGSRGSRLVKQLASGLEACVSFAELNSWVMAKSGMHHSANYRSAVLFGCFQLVEDEREELAAYEHFVEQLEVGRWSQIRQPNDKELKATSLLKMEIGEGSVKQRTGGPNDDLEDLSLPVWVGEIPLIKKWGERVEYES